MTLPLTSTCVGGRRAGSDACAVMPIPTRKAPQRPLLTRREREVLEAVIDTGFCTLAAVRLGISHKTVETHMLRMREKAFALSNYQLVAAFAAGGFE